MTEKELQANIVKLARLLGYLVYHTYDSRKSEPGFPDLVMVRWGDHRLIFAELKSAKGKVTDPQRRWLEHLGLVCMEVEAYVWRPEDWTSGTIEQVLRGTE